MLTGFRGHTIHGKILAGEKLANLANREPFTKILLANIHRYTENVYAIYTDCSLFTKFFLINSFYLHGYDYDYDVGLRLGSLYTHSNTYNKIHLTWFAKIFPCQIFPMYGSWITYKIILNIRDRKLAHHKSLYTNMWARHALVWISWLRINFQG